MYNYKPDKEIYLIIANGARSIRLYIFLASKTKKKFPIDIL